MLLASVSSIIRRLLGTDAVTPCVAVVQDMSSTSEIDQLYTDLEDSLTSLRTFVDSTVRNIHTRVDTLRAAYNTLQNNVDLAEAAVSMRDQALASVRLALDTARKARDIETARVMDVSRRLQISEELVSQLRAELASLRQASDKPSDPVDAKPSDNIEEELIRLFGLASSKFLSTFRESFGKPER